MTVLSEIENKFKIIIKPATDSSCNKIVKFNTFNIALEFDVSNHPFTDVPKDYFVFGNEAQEACSYLQELFENIH